MSDTQKKMLKGERVKKLRMFVGWMPLPRMSGYMSSLQPIWDSGGTTHDGAVRCFLLSLLGDSDSDLDPSWGNKTKQRDGVF